ncbi:hypothetical protein FEM48_ZijujUnG0118600 [Ziziphus jujuba var. spinosa]|uniref:TFIID subunit TAF5 NTD2 domain-containing protein n=1 Tax=Ziziphus jujuba var. spinosa TaxID=714518 RepID=A0A978U7X0_ZIZJJ|nr:hypothetical protein FEM48_ZijujUnG0118600 [Ziziphus jujuba var. spinosa]
MDDESILKFVTEYLKKKGFKQTENAFQEELHQTKTTTTNNNSASPISSTSQFDSDIAKHILSLTESENAPTRYQDGYSKLRSWTYSSLDSYRHELLRVLYPVFIHCFMDLVANGHVQEARTFFNSFREDHEMMHLRDLQKLEGVLSPSHLEEMEFAHTLRKSKISIKMCQYSYDLLLQFLQKPQSTTILGIINEHINFQVSPGPPSSICDDADVVTVIGGSQDAANQINQKEVHWGLLEDSLEERLEKAGSLLSDSEKAEGETKELEWDENKKRSADGGKQGASIKKLKKDKAVNVTGKTARPEANSIPTAPRVKPELALPVIPAEVEQSILEDLRNRVQLSSVALPSVSFYTFINTHNSLNCSSISHDGSLVAGGFSDSSLKVWDMAKLGQQAVGCKVLDNSCFVLSGFASHGELDPSLYRWLSIPPCCSYIREILMLTRTGLATLQGESDATPNEHTLGSNGGKRPYTLFQGHSGPVYSATFSPLGDFILSSSSDSTVRLWSSKLNANLVCYKGHNYPVWDVQFSPVGHYFASASHDRTARIWSMDRVQPLRIMAGHLSDVDCVQWHANCNYIATGSSDKTVRLWDVQTGECVRIFIGHRSMILSLAMSPDGRYMASGDEDGAIMMWDLSSGRCVTPLIAHTSCVWTLAFSCEGSLLASGSADCTVKLWDVTTSTKVSRTEEK